MQPMPAGCRATDPRIAAVLGSAAICCQAGPLQPTRECTGEKDEQNKAADQMALNLPPLVREKSAKTRCFTFY